MVNYKRFIAKVPEDRVEPVWYGRQPEFEVEDGEIEQMEDHFYGPIMNAKEISEFEEEIKAKIVEKLESEKLDAEQRIGVDQSYQIGYMKGIDVAVELAGEVDVELGENKQ